MKKCSERLKKNVEQSKIRKEIVTDFMIYRRRIVVHNTEILM